jgi:hypothetical protein
MKSTCDNSNHTWLDSDAAPEAVGTGERHSTERPQRFRGRSPGLGAEGSKPLDGTDVLAFSDQSVVKPSWNRAATKKETGGRLKSPPAVVPGGRNLIYDERKYYTTFWVELKMTIVKSSCNYPKMPDCSIVSR